MSMPEARGSGDRSETAVSRYRLDGSYRRPGDGRVVIGGSPLRLLTLSAGGVAWTGEAVYSRYNAPFTPWFLRRNEIWLPLADAS